MDPLHHALGVTHEPDIALLLDHLFPERRPDAGLHGQLGHDLETLEAEVALDVLVGLHVPGQALVVPGLDGGVPVTEIHVGHPVRAAAAKHLEKSVGKGHAFLLISGSVHPGDVAAQGIGPPVSGLRKAP